MADAERLRGELYAAFKNRALMYWHVFDELREALGESQASTLMARAIEARGREIGRPFARFAPADLAGLRDAFVGGVPDAGRMFAPRVERCDTAGLNITLQRCPLKEAWQEAADTWRPGHDGCCHLHIRPGAR
jgi:hypothetical protein